MMHIVQILEKTVSPGKLCESSNSPGGERCACVPRLYSCPKPWIAQEKKGVSVRDGIKDGRTAVYGKASSVTGEDCSRKKKERQQLHRNPSVPCVPSEPLENGIISVSLNVRHTQLP